MTGCISGGIPGVVCSAIAVQTVSTACCDRGQNPSFSTVSAHSGRLESTRAGEGQKWGERPLNRVAGSDTKIDRSRRVQPRAATVWASWRSWRITCSRVSSQAACSVLSPERQCSWLRAAPLPPSRSHRLRSSGPSRPPASKRSTIIIGATTAALTTTITIGRIIILITTITTIGRIITITTIDPIFTSQQRHWFGGVFLNLCRRARAMELIRGRERSLRRRCSAGCFASGRADMAFLAFIIEDNPPDVWVAPHSMTGLNPFTRSQVSNAVCAK